MTRRRSCDLREARDRRARASGRAAPSGWPRARARLDGSAVRDGRLGRAAGAPPPPFGGADGAADRRSRARRSAPSTSARRRGREPAGQALARAPGPPARQPAEVGSPGDPTSRAIDVAAGPAARGRARLGGGALPDRSRARRSRRRCSWASRSGASSSTAPTAPAAPPGSTTCAASSPTCRSTCRACSRRRASDRFLLNFPDPWFKTRQHKRRVVGPELVEEIHRALAPGGELFVQTDIFDLALEAMAVLEAEAPRASSTPHAPWSFLPANPFAAKSRRERQCEGEGAQIWRLLYRTEGLGAVARRRCRYAQRARRRAAGLPAP